MVDYSDAPWPVRKDFAESHTRYWQRLQSAGNWFSSKDRIAIATEVRNAGSCKMCIQQETALSPNTFSGPHDTPANLRPVVTEAVHRITRDASRLSGNWLEKLKDDGLSHGEYIEIVGTVVAVVSIDSFCKALGLPLRDMPEPGDGNPDNYTPATAVINDEAWVPMVPAINVGTPEADLWSSGKTGTVIRAMSLVPDEVRTLCDLSDAHYLPMAKVRLAGVDAGRALNRSQMELVAGRVSALNRCYY